ncbi:4-hydroxyproline epimerase [Rubripirellula obstinata]|uniref:4-hydroxyproline epimerase n=1 Tax=Rubripirellula obstinata TaxID=406547 RepID=A0A5B1CIZ5_9BACT|nr:proline racemase family protein [Rubripirellula obstinata]KAA1259403.1 4-hydroxyproline epimerase [Rubripirellula obstinata]
MHVVDSHTEGEPTRVIVDGGPDLGLGPLDERLSRFRRDADSFRAFAVNEPRGWDAMVGALLCEPNDSSCDAGVIFFNNVGYLGMCGHGIIGVAVTLHYLGRLGLGVHRIETPVGVVAVDLIGPNEVTIENIPSYRFRKDVSVDVEGVGMVTGDIAWGGNWFYLVHGSPLPLQRENLDQLVTLSRRISKTLADKGHTGVDGAMIDHVEFSVDSADTDSDSVNFVLCPGGIYDRSPCGTGTSAKLACLAADGLLAPQTQWVQRSVTEGRFRASYRPGPSLQMDPLQDNRDTVIASITGRAFICGETKLIAQAGDPFANGIASQQVAHPVRNSDVR